MPRRRIRRNLLRETTLHQNDNVCQLCLAEFIDLEDCKEHIKQTHINEICRSRYCENCAVLCTDIQSYAMHIIYTHLSTMKSCLLCHKVFYTVSEQQDHALQHNRFDYKLMCSECDSDFDSIEQLSDHEYVSHKFPQSGIWLCHMYDVLSSILNIKVDNMRFLMNKENTCTNCHFTGDMESYVEHLSNKNCMSFVCAYCLSIFSKKSELKAHFRTSPSCVRANLEFTRCRHCDQVFSFEGLKHHGACLKYKCSICNGKFMQIDDLTYHQSNCHENSIVLIKCKYCTKEFVGQSGLDKHMQRAHQKKLHLYKYRCLDCDAVYEHPQKLFAHFATKHRELEPYTCTICNLKFRLRKKFSIHIKLNHKDEGTVKFDENFHVSYTIKQKDVSSSNVLELETTESDPKTKDKTEKTSKGMVNNSNTLNETYTDTETLDPGSGTVNNVDDNPEQEATDTSDQEDLLKELPASKKRINPNSKENTSKINERKRNIEDTEVEYLSSDEEDLPLNYLIKRSKRGPSQLKKPMLNMTKKTNKFTCKVCNKYCYTFQNYQFHMTLHSSKAKKCLKCGKIFKNKHKLENHITKQHSTSQLTQKLHEILQRRKAGTQTKTVANVETDQSEPMEEINTEVEETLQQKIRKTIKRVPIQRSDTVATIKEVGFSVQNFLENFTPESMERKVRNELKIEQSATLRAIKSNCYRKPSIKLIKFTPRKNTTPVRLALPKKANTESVMDKVKLKVNIVRCLPTEPPEEEFDTDFQNDDLEEAREPTPPLTGIEEFIENTNIVLPNLPQDIMAKEVRVARLQKEYPYFNIVKLSDLQKPVTKEPPSKKKPVTMPDGTKLVAVNPLAHLLGNRSIDHLIEEERKRKDYYKKKEYNMEEAVAKALMSNESTPRYRKKKNINSAQLERPSIG